MKKLVSILLLFASLLAARSATPGDEKKLQRLPPEVRQTVMQHLGEGSIGRVAKIPGEDGSLSYAVVIKKDGRVRGLTIATDGKLLEMEVFFEETPAVVQRTIRTIAGGIKPDNISQAADESGAINYEVEITQAGATRDFTVKANGTLASIQVFWAEVPAPVQKTIRQTVGNGGLGDITKTMEDGETNYDVEMKKNGQDREFSVATDGQLRRIELDLTETPAPVQKTIQAELKDGRIVEITRETDEDESVFVVKLAEAGKTRELNISPDGRIVPAN